MRLRILLLTAGAMLVAPATAVADFAHTVLPGETLTSIAAADGLSVDQLAAANGISPDTDVITGTTVMIPPQDSTGTASSDVSTVQESSSPSASSGGGSYVVQPGDTLWALAQREGTSVDALAAANGLDPNGVLLSGSTISLAGAPVQSSMTDAASSQPVGAAAEGSTSAPPYPTEERVSASEVGDIASSEGVPPALAEAIAYQESGFNNDLVSNDDARGVMQILPGTWSWVSQDLATPPAPDPSSAQGNIRAGTLLLHSLLASTGGNEALAAAGYYQGLPSVEQNGEYADTQQYVNDVMSLAQQFGGG